MKPELGRLLDDLAERPWAYDFRALLRQVQALHPELPRLGSARRPQDEPIRLGQAPELSFAPAELHGVAAATAGRPPRIDQRFFGLFGPNGPLPLHLTEHARLRRQQGDEAFARFADLFHHRLLLLFWRAWAQAQPTVSLDRPDDPFGQMAASLIGLGSPTLRGRDRLDDHLRLYGAALLARDQRHAEGLQTLVELLLGRPVEVQQFAGQWLALEPEERSRIGGRAGTRLGQDGVLGRTVWDRQHHFRLRIVGLDRAGFEALLPEGALLGPLIDLVDFYTGGEWGWELELELLPEARRGMRLGGRERLGWSSWAGPGRARPLRLNPSSLRKPRTGPAQAEPRPRTS